MKKQRGKFMVLVGGFTYKTRVSRRQAYGIKRKLNGCVYGVRVQKMPELVG